MTRKVAAGVAAGALDGVVVLDLSRVLAGPWATQALGDLGAEVIKVEQPGIGDDTRQWGPPFVPTPTGRDSAYFMCANRNKLGIEVDFSKPEGADVIRSLAAQADVLVENFKVGGLARFGLDHAALHAINPRLIYCSITGFGQTGPYASRGGYDFLIQGMSGLMSVTGRPDGQPGAGPLRAGVPVSDLFTGLYACNAILAALIARERTGEGQHIDCALLDTQLAVLANQASNHLVGNAVPTRMGNSHPNVVPYRDFATRDGHVIIAAGNDRQFQALCRLLGRADLAADPDYATIPDRHRNRAVLEAALEAEVVSWASAVLVHEMAKHGVPGGPINTIPEAFGSPQVQARAVVQTVTRSDGAAIDFVRYPAILSSSPAACRLPPPLRGEHTVQVLRERLKLDGPGIASLRSRGILGAEAPSPDDRAGPR